MRVGYQPVITALQSCNVCMMSDDEIDSQSDFMSKVFIVILMDSFLIRDHDVS